MAAEDRLMARSAAGGVRRPLGGQPVDLARNVRRRSVGSHSCAGLDLLDFGDVELVEQEALVERLALAAPDLAQEVFFEGDLGVVNPFALRRPVDVARRDLRLRQEGDAGIAEIRETDGVPGRLRRRRSRPAAASRC